MASQPASAQLAAHLILTGRSQAAWELVQKEKCWNSQLAAAAPSKGYEVWADGMRARTSRLVAGGHVHWAVCHLLAIGDVWQAVQLYMSHGMQREALTLARCRLHVRDPAFSTLLDQLLRRRPPTALPLQQLPLPQQEPRQRLAQCPVQQEDEHQQHMLRHHEQEQEQDESQQQPAGKQQEQEQQQGPGSQHVAAGRRSGSEHRTPESSATASSSREAAAPLAAPMDVAAVEETQMATGLLQSEAPTAATGLDLMVSPSPSPTVNEPSGAVVAIGVLAPLAATMTSAPAAAKAAAVAAAAAGAPPPARQVPPEALALQSLLAGKPLLAMRALRSSGTASALATAAQLCALVLRQAERGCGTGDRGTSGRREMASSSQSSGCDGFGQSGPEQQQLVWRQEDHSGGYEAEDPEEQLEGDDEALETMGRACAAAALRALFRETLWNIAALAINGDGQRASGRCPGGDGVTSAAAAAAAMETQTEAEVHIAVAAACGQVQSAAASLGGAVLAGSHCGAALLGWCMRRLRQIGLELTDSRNGGGEGGLGSGGGDVSCGLGNAGSDEGDRREGGLNTGCTAVSAAAIAASAAATDQENDYDEDDEMALQAVHAVYLGRTPRPRSGGDGGGGYAIRRKVVAQRRPEPPPPATANRGTAGVVADTAAAPPPTGRGASVQVVTDQVLGTQRSSVESNLGRSGAGRSVQEEVVTVADVATAAVSIWAASCAACGVRKDDPTVACSVQAILQAAAEAAAEAAEAMAGSPPSARQQPGMRVRTSAGESGGGMSSHRPQALSSVKPEGFDGAGIVSGVAQVLPSGSSSRTTLFEAVAALEEAVCRLAVAAMHLAVAAGHPPAPPKLTPNVASGAETSTLDAAAQAVVTAARCCATFMPPLPPPQPSTPSPPTPRHHVASGPTSSAACCGAALVADRSHQPNNNQQHWRAHGSGRSAPSAAPAPGAASVRRGQAMVRTRPRPPTATAAATAGAAVITSNDPWVDDRGDSSSPAAPLHLLHLLQQQDMEVGQQKSSDGRYRAHQQQQQHTARNAAVQPLESSRKMHSRLRYSWSAMLDVRRRMLALAAAQPCNGDLTSELRGCLLSAGLFVGPSENEV